MSGILGATPQAEPMPARPAAKPATLGETWTAARTLARGDRTDADAERLRRGYEPVLAEINADRAARGLKPLINPGLWVGDVDRRPSADNGTLDIASIFSPTVDRRGQQAAIFAELREIRKRNPAFLKDLPDNADAYGKALIERERAARTSARDTLGRSEGVIAGLTSFGGAVVETMHDPVNLWTLPLGGGGKTIAAQIGRSILVNGALEAVQQPLVAENRATLGEDFTFGEAAANVGFAATGGVIGDVLLPQAAKALGKAVADVAVPLDRRIALALKNADLPDDALAASFREIVPDAVRSFDERAAVHVITREAEVRASSPFKGAGPALDGHAARLQASMERLLAVNGTAPPPVAGRAAAAVASAVPSVSMQFRAILGLEGGIDRAGNFRTSPAGAIGPAQVMPATAPEAAKLAGVPFDEARYRSDADYNRVLGEAYYREQLRVFGDPDKAAAAYNAGPGSAKRGTGVRGAMRKAADAGEPDNWEKYLPAETQAYVKGFRERTGVQASAGRAIDEVDGVVVRPAAMDAERAIIDGPAPVEIDVPELRRDLFADDASWRAAQDAADAEALGIAAPVQSFRTAKGSVYVVEPGGTTTRDKMPRPEHPGVRERGVQPTSETTFYARPADLQALSLMQTQGGERIAVTLDRGHAAIKYVSGPQSGKIIPDTIIPIERQPAVGLHPVETWKGGERVHFGNEIVETSGAPMARADVASQAAARAVEAPAIRDEAAAAAPRVAEGPRQLDLFDDPKGLGATLQADSLVHDLRARLGVEPSADGAAIGARAYRLEDGSERSGAEILADLDEDEAMLATIKGCL